MATAEHRRYAAHSSVGTQPKSYRLILKVKVKQNRREVAFKMVIRQYRVNWSNSLMLTNLSLVKLTPKHRQEFLSLVEDFHAAGEDRFHADLEQIHHNFDEYTQHLLEMEVGIGLPEGMVPQTTLWLVKDDIYLIGKSHLRHQLTSTLEHHGGHIGYFIRPSERGKGYGTCLLELTLGAAYNIGLSRILITCDTDNISSARVIEKNGGVLEDQLISNVSGVMISRYWIQL